MRLESTHLGLILGSSTPEFCELCLSMSQKSQLQDDESLQRLNKLARGKDLADNNNSSSS